jgi:hypothetical protein
MILLELLKSIWVYEFSSNRMNTLRKIFLLLPTMGLKARLLSQYCEELKEEAFYFNILYQMTLDRIPEAVKDPSFNPFWSPATLVLYSAVHKDFECLNWLYETKDSKIDTWYTQVVVFCPTTFHKSMQVTSHQLSRIQVNYQRLNPEEVKFAFILASLISKHGVQRLKLTDMSDSETFNVMKRMTSDYSPEHVLTNTAWRSHFVVPIPYVIYPTRRKKSVNFLATIPE